MQDNLHDDLFTDHAWQEMHKILDREMPERKRRGFLFWLLPALGLCLLTAQDSLMGNDIPVASKTAMGNKQAIAARKADEQTKPDKSAKAKLHKDIPLVQNQTTPVVQDNQTSVQLEIAARPGKEFGLKSSATESTKPTDLSGWDDHAQGANQATPEIPLNSLTPKLPVASESLPDQQGSTSKPELDDSQPLSEKRNTLGLVPTAHFDLNQPDSKPETPELSFQKRHQKLEWWAEAGTQITNGVQGLSGYRVGILAGIPMGQFRLRVGTGFTQTEVDFKSVQLDSTGQTRTMDVQLNTQTTPGFNASKGSSTTPTVSSINLQLIDLNVGLYHPLGKRFGAALGGSVQYVQGIRLGGQYFNASLFESANQDKTAPVTSQNGGSTSSPILTQNSSLTKANFRNLVIALHGELSYQLAPRWSTSLGYRYSTRGFTKSSDLVLRPNWVELGVRFRVK
ncbi:hypothetical protein [Haliscomenobacter sp.]|uniref:hypothetical protein n=1 Tax=Haliscomenobacter sp. TaxID=2717303 RepID=UPI003364D772